MNPLIRAIENNNINQLKLLLDLGHDPNKEVADEKFPWIKRYPLSIAHSNNIVCAEILLKAGASPNTIINHVIADLNLPWCKLIIEYIDATGLNRLIKASINKRNVRVLELLVENNPEIKKKFVPEMLCDAVMRGHEPMAKFLVRIGIDVNSADRHFATPLMHAAHNNRPETAQLLVEHGADVNYCNDLNITSLIEASKNNAMEVAKLLLENGADIHVVDWEGYTALDHAKQRKNTELILEIEKYLNTKK